MKEIDFLKERNETYQSVDFVDISAEDYSPEDNQGIDFETAMSTIHAILPDGTVITGIPVFQKLYEVSFMCRLIYDYSRHSIQRAGELADCSDRTQ